MARRRPISRVRSVTLTSMMFMMPMPPTSKLTAATAPKSVVITLVAPAMVSASCLVSSTLKLSSSPGASLRSSRSSSVQTGLDALGIAAIGHRDQNRVQPLVARHAPLQGGQGQKHHIVLVIAKRALAFGAEQAHDLARKRFQAQLLTQDIGGVVEQFAVQGAANQAHRRPGALLLGREGRGLAPAASCR